MTQSNRAPREPIGYAITCWVLFGTAFFLFFCPEFVQSSFNGKVEFSLIPKGLENRWNTVKRWLQVSPELTQPEIKSVSQLFGEVGKLGPGAIAIGNAEGTLTSTGTPTWAYYGHTDPANRVTNRGFASWQASPVKDAREADQKAMQRIKTQCVPYTFKTFKQAGLTLTPRLLVESCDIWIQAPRAAVDFASNIKGCQQRGELGEEAILCARIKNYIDPATGQFDVAAIFAQPGTLEADQQRRMGAIAATLKRFKVPTVFPAGKA